MDMTANSMERINLEQTVGMLMPPPQIKERLNLIRSLLNDIGQLPERGRPVANAEVRHPSPQVSV